MEECATCWLENPATIQKQEKQQLLVVGWTIAHQKPRKAIEKESVIQSAPSIRCIVTIQSAGEIVFVGRLKIDIASIYLKDLKVFFESWSTYLIPPWGKQHSSWNEILFTQDSQNYRKAQTRQVRSPMKPWCLKNFKFPCQESIQKLAKFSMWIHRNQAPQRRSSSGPGDPEKEETRGRSITCLCGWHQLGKLGSKCPN